MSQVKLEPTALTPSQQLVSKKRKGYLAACEMRLDQKIAQLKISDPQALREKRVEHVQSVTKYLGTFLKVTAKGFEPKYQTSITKLNEMASGDEDQFLKALFEECLVLAPGELEHLEKHFDHPIKIVIQTAKRYIFLSQTSSSYLIIPSLKQDLKNLLHILLKRNLTLTASAIMVQFHLLNREQTLLLEQITLVSIPITRQLIEGYLAGEFLAPDLQLVFANTQEAIQCTRIFHQCKQPHLIQQTLDYLVLENEVQTAQVLAHELQVQPQMVQSLISWGYPLELLSYMNQTQGNPPYSQNLYQRVITDALKNTEEERSLNPEALRSICSALELFLFQFKTFPNVAKQLFKMLPLMDDPTVLHEFYLNSRHPFLKVFFLVLYSSTLIQGKKDFAKGMEVLKDFTTLREELHPENRAQFEKFINSNFTYLRAEEKWEEAHILAVVLLKKDDRESSLRELANNQPLKALKYYLEDSSSLTKLDIELFLIALKYRIPQMTQKDLYDTCGLIDHRGLHNYLYNFARGLDSFYLRQLRPLFEGSNAFAEAKNQGERFVQCCSLIDSHSKELKNASLGLNRHLFITIYACLNL